MIFPQSGLLSVYAVSSPADNSGAVNSMKAYLSAILANLKKGICHTNVEIVTPAFLSRDSLFNALASCTDKRQMLDFISLLSRTPGVQVYSKTKTVSMGNAARFADIYANTYIDPTLLSKEKQNTIIEHLQQCQFDKDQLIYLIKNLSSHQLWDLVLSSPRLSIQNLKEICNDFGLISTLNTETGKLIYKAMNPAKQVKSMKATTPYLDMYYYACRYGHVLGLSQSLSLKINNQVLKLQTNGEFAQISLSLLIHFLDKYHERFHDTCFKPITEAITSCSDLYKNNCYEYKDNAAGVLQKRYHDKKLTFITTGWYGHGIGITLYGKYLAFRNRGEAGNMIFGGKIYEIKNPALVNNLICKLVHRQINARSFHALLSTVVELDNPVLKLFSKAQKRGNCTFANPKSSIMDMLLLQQVGPNATHDALMTAEKQRHYRRIYKEFTKFIRNDEIDEIIKNMFYATHPHLIQFYAELVKAYITEHHGKKRGYVKDRQEIIRAYDLYERSTSQVQAILKTDGDFMTLVSQVKNDYEHLDGHPNCIHQPPHSTLVWDYKRRCHRQVAVEKGMILAIDNTPTPKMRFSFKMAKKLMASSH